MLEGLESFMYVCMRLNICHDTTIYVSRYMYYANLCISAYGCMVAYICFMYVCMYVNDIQHVKLCTRAESMTMSGILVKEDAHAAFDILVLAHENLEVFKVRGYWNARFFARGQKCPFIFLSIV